MSKKRVVFICLLCLMTFTMVGFAFASSVGFLGNGDAADLWALEQDALKDAQNPEKANIMNEEADLLSRSYKIASDEQKALLDNIDTENFLGAVGVYTKQIKIIMNELPVDTPYITLEQAVNICSMVDVDDYNTVNEFEHDIVQQFNQITGAPDFEGGSGIHRVVYFLDDDHSKYIIIRLGSVIYVDTQSDLSETLLSVLS